MEKFSLARLLKDQNGLNLVILNSCYSQNQAQCVADAVGHVIGMEGAIIDTDAIDFSREFSTALGYGRTFEESFRRTVPSCRGIEQFLNVKSTLLEGTFQ